MKKKIKQRIRHISEICVIPIMLCYFTGCTDLSQRNYITGKNNNIRWTADKFEYDGHYYIEFTDHSGMAGDGGIVHDPDCPCIKENNKIEN